jgi:hypothetical protein
MVLAMLVLVSVSAHAAEEKLSVQIIERQASDTQYVYSVPGYRSTNCNVSGYGNSAWANCASSESAAFTGEYHVSGATFTLKLPDGRLVVVNCDSKWDQWALTPTHRNCRQPLTNKIEVRFNGDSAKLEWVVSIDGKKKQSETYKILGVFVNEK